MKAVGYKKSLPIEAPGALEDIDIEPPTPGPRDLLVAVHAVSVNPVDVKVRARSQPESGYRILGFDAAGVVEAVGSEVTHFEPGDEVFYAGDIRRAGTNAELHLVDERIVGMKPSSLCMTDAAALPLTSITAWEMLFDSFRLPQGGGRGDTLLIIGGAGGVGSILIQLAKALTGLRVVATASREVTQTWCVEMGADDVIDHRRPLVDQIEALAVTPRYVASLTASEKHFDSVVDLIAPRGQIAMIDDPGSLDVAKLKSKAISFHWECMFTRPMFETADMDAQRSLLCRVGQLVDAGKLRSTVTERLGRMAAASLIEAHKRQESGRGVGKLVLDAALPDCATA